MLISPFSKTDKNRLKNRIFILFVFLVLGIVLLRYLDGFLINDIVANGIISFELARDVTVSKNMINSWNAVSTAAAGYSIIVDFVFLTVYSLFIALLIHHTNENVWKNKTIYKIGVVLIFAQFTAAFFDIIENVALLQLFKNTIQFWTSTAYYCASLKFLLIFLGVLFIVISWIFKLLKNNN